MKPVIQSGPGAGRSTVVGLLLFVVLIGRGDAQPDAAARTLFQEAVRLDREGRHELAEARLRELSARFPGSPWVSKAAARLRPGGVLAVTALRTSGPSSNRIDLAFLGDGFQRTQGDQQRFNELVDRARQRLFAVSPFRAYRAYFNVHRINLASATDAIPPHGEVADSALGARRLPGPHGYVAVDPERVREVLRGLPWNDGLAVVLVHRAEQGSAAAGVAVTSGRAGELAHELGHALGRLGDEYVESTGAARAAGRWFNLATVRDPARVPWAHWLEAGTPGVGVFPGGHGRKTGLWRPTPGRCIMAGGPEFCPVCREQLVRAVYGVVSPVDRATPVTDRQAARGESLDYFVETPVPETHAVEVEWRLARAAGPDQVEVVPTVGKGQATPLRSRHGPREWPPLTGRVVARTRGERTGRHTRLHVFRLETRDLKPGCHQLLLRVRDTTPWVRKDPLHLLEERRVYRVTVLPRAGS